MNYRSNWLEICYGFVEYMTFYRVKLNKECNTKWLKEVYLCKCTHCHNMFVLRNQIILTDGFSNVNAFKLTSFWSTIHNFTLIWKCIIEFNWMAPQCAHTHPPHWHTSELGETHTHPFWKLCADQAPHPRFLAPVLFCFQSQLAITNINYFSTAIVVFNWSRLIAVLETATFGKSYFYAF